MKAILRKTGEIVDIVSWNGSTVRTQLDTVSYIDSQGIEHDRESLNLYWDFELIDTKDKDAKDGDVIVNGSNVFLFSHISDTRVMGYCHVNVDNGRFYDDEGKNECFGLIDSVFTPATQEERKLLFQMMEDAGYVRNKKNKFLCGMM